MALSTNSEAFKELQAHFHDCLGSSFWEKQEESPKLLQSVRAVNLAHKLSVNKDFKPCPALHTMGTKQWWDEFFDKRFPGVRKCLTAMGPYLDQPAEDVTGRIAHELHNSNMFWFNHFTEFIHWVLLVSPSRLSDEVLPILDLDPSEWETGSISKSSE